MSRQRPEVIELLDSSSSTLNLSSPTSKSNGNFKIDEISDEEIEKTTFESGIFNDTREKLLRIVDSSKSASAPRYNKLNESANSAVPPSFQKLSAEIYEDDDSHTGLTQEYSILKVSNVVTKKRIKVKADALQEICIQIPQSVKNLLKEEEDEEFAILSEIEWTNDTSLIDDVKFIFWRHRNEEQDPYDYVVALVELESVYQLIESKEFSRLFTRVFQYCQQKRKFLYLLGVRRFLQRLQAQENKHFKQTLAKGRMLTPERMTKPSWMDLEHELYISALDNSIQIIVVQDGILAAHLVEMTKCIAWEPHVRLQKEEMGGAMGATDVRTGRNLPDTWRKMLSVIPKVSDITAGLIVDKYPTVQSLSYAFHMGGPSVLENLQLSNRRLGSALSNRIYVALMGNDSKALIQQ